METDLYTLRSEVVKALAHPLRLQIVDLLLKVDEMCVCELVDALEATQSTVSKHLAVMRGAGVVSSRREGLMVYYRLRTPCLKGFFNCIDRILQADLKTRQDHLLG